MTPEIPRAQQLERAIDLPSTTSGRLPSDECDPASLKHEPRIAVLVPCHNEESTVGDVVRDFRRALPTATVFVYDNASSDLTSERALEAGAIVHFEPLKGKGNVIRRMFADIDADIYVLVDGDGTYDAPSSPKMTDHLLRHHLDMVVGVRSLQSPEVSQRRGHAIGNAFFTRTVRVLFGGRFTDVLSGYRVMSRRFVKSLPMFSSGFEIETELCAHAERVHAASAEFSTPYRRRDDGSTSKLRTFRDGWRILVALIRLLEEMRPLLFFGVCFVILTAVALALGVPVIDEFIRTKRVGRFPTAILAVSIQIVAFLSLAAGAILRSVARVRDEVRQMMYLQIPAPDVTIFSLTGQEGPRNKA